MWELITREFVSPARSASFVIVTMQKHAVARRWACDLAWETTDELNKTRSGNKQLAIRRLKSRGCDTHADSYYLIQPLDSSIHTLPVSDYFQRNVTSFRDAPSNKLNAARSSSASRNNHNARQKEFNRALGFVFTLILPFINGAPRKWFRQRWWVLVFSIMLETRGWRGCRET